MTATIPDRLVVGLEGPWPTGFEAAWLVEHQPAGVIIFPHNIIDYSHLRSLCAVLHELVDGLEICADHEGGPVSQLAAALGRPPAAWSLGLLDDTGLTARVCRETGRRLVSAGVDRVLAPVADVLTEWRNPVIGARSFGSDPAVVSRQVVAAVTGYLESGALVCLKHWPGHGGSLGDSHHVETGTGLGMVPGPFADGLTAGADAVMVGHLLRSAGNDKGRTVPASLDRGFLHESREELGAGNIEDLLFFADDVTMGALGPAMEEAGVEVPAALPSGLYDPAGLPRPWFERLAAAGCDRLLVRGIPARAFPLTDSARELPEPAAGGTEKADQRGSCPYEEARRRIWDVQGCGDFAPGDTGLLWLDLSRGDRWEAAAGSGDGALEECRAVLDRRFDKVVTDSGSWPPDEPCCRLLVTSHRPLPGSFAADLANLAFLAKQGFCLAMGHPGLKRDLEGALGAGWRVGTLGDITAADLFPGPADRGTKI